MKLGVLNDIIKIENVIVIDVNNIENKKEPTVAALRSKYWPSPIRYLPFDRFEYCSVVIIVVGAAISK